MFFKRKSTGYPQAKPTPEVLEARMKAAREWGALLKRVSDLEIALRTLDEQHSTTVSQLNKLRGQVHGGRNRASVGEDPEEPRFGDKEALRRKAGLQHGVRFIHPIDPKE